MSDVIRTNLSSISLCHSFYTKLVHFRYQNLLISGLEHFFRLNIIARSQIVFFLCVCACVHAQDVDDTPPDSWKKLPYHVPLISHFSLRVVRPNPSLAMLLMVNRPNTCCHIEVHYSQQDVAKGNIFHLCSQLVILFSTNGKRAGLTEI